MLSRLDTDYDTSPFVTKKKNLGQGALLARENKKKVKESLHIQNYSKDQSTEYSHGTC